ncbi:MAG: hypothetical protein GF404_10115 [candidate division Zixibacteria bacterium]|nr:hypothetical protein [candidate division Zixibacteria bacterium]
MLSKFKTEIVLIVVAMTCFSLWLVSETNLVRIEYHDLSRADMGTKLHGLRIAHLSDLHTSDYGLLEQIVIRRLMDIDPDLIFLTGDYIDYNDEIPACSIFLGRIAEIAVTVATLGNNDHSFRGREIELERLKNIFSLYDISLLQNQSALLHTGTDSVFLVGLDDDYLWFDDYYLASYGIPDSVPKIVLAHSPDVAHKIDLTGVKLILSGHTHGGQIRVPYFNEIYSNTRFDYTSGLSFADDSSTVMYNNRGLGTTMIPLRLFSAPEIAVFDF